MEALALALLKAVATTCLKLYLTSLLGGGAAIDYDKSELGYKVPKWYMNPGRTTKEFYAYGTSTRGDEFESIADARQRALEQMVNHIRLANQKLVQDHVRFNRDSLKQKRLVELFIRGEGLESFIRLNAALDKKELVKVERGDEDIRAFIRLAMPADAFVDYQERTVKDLKHKILRQKSDDILAEMEAEKTEAEKGLSGMPEAQPVSLPRPNPQPSPPAGSDEPTPPVPGADSAFEALEQEITE